MRARTIVISVSLLLAAFFVGLFPLGVRAGSESIDYTGNPFDPNDCGLCYHECKSGKLTASVKFDETITSDYIGPAWFEAGHPEYSYGVASVTVGAFGYTYTKSSNAGDNVYCGPSPLGRCGFSASFSLMNGKILDWNIYLWNKFPTDSDPVEVDFIYSNGGEYTPEEDVEDEAEIYFKESDSWFCGHNKNKPGTWGSMPPADLEIEAPKKGTMFPLSEENSISTKAIEFKIKGAGLELVNWTTKIEYATSGGKGKSTKSDTFYSYPGKAATHQYSSCGGRLTVNASTTTGQAPPLQYLYIVGSEIAKDTITTQLINLYHGTTPKLLTGIASQESSYLTSGLGQFLNGNTIKKKMQPGVLYGKKARWPYESSDGGSHIGLMMVKTKMNTAFDWLANTSAGLNILLDSIKSSKIYEKQDRKQLPQLPALSAIQHEDNALCYYRLGSGKKDNRYWTIGSDNNSWIKNEDACLDKEGKKPFNYADRVRSLIVGSAHTNTADYRDTDPIRAPREAIKTTGHNKALDKYIGMDWNSSTKASNSISNIGKANILSIVKSLSGKQVTRKVEISEYGFVVTDNDSKLSIVASIDDECVSCPNRLAVLKLINNRIIMFEIFNEYVSLDNDLIDIDNDGVYELVGKKPLNMESSGVGSISYVCWPDIYKWDGYNYILANIEYPEYYKEIYIPRMKREMSSVETELEEAMKEELLTPTDRGIHDVLSKRLSNLESAVRRADRLVNR